MLSVYFLKQQSMSLARESGRTKTDHNNSLCFFKSNHPVLLPAPQQTACGSFSVPFLPPFPVIFPSKHSSVHSLLYPSPQFQQAFLENPQATPAKEAGTLTANLHISLLSSKSSPPISSPHLQQTICCSLFLLSAPISCRSQRSFPPTPGLKSVKQKPNNKTKTQ